ncbi:hypothetical protein L4C33_14995 [Vibrio makurazakiensis]|uniref:hypothetical protein n=1 Tax=Vibrio makurazakiensis TaxID=2910250 RepID=UPI003D104C35
MKRQKARKDIDYTLDPITSRATFKKNNKAALIHGGYSHDISDSILEAILDNDLGFEVGILKGQLTNIHTLGSQLTQTLLLQGEEATALSVLLSCADRSSKLVPQIQKLLKNSAAQHNSLNHKELAARKRWLKKLKDGVCLPSEVAYQFETQQLGEPPAYVQKMIDVELRSCDSEVEDELFSRTDLQQQLCEYWEATKKEAKNKQIRQKEVHDIKQQINREIFEPSEGNNDG